MSRTTWLCCCPALVRRAIAAASFGVMVPAATSAQLVSLEARTGPHRADLEMDHWSGSRRSMSSTVGVDLALGRWLGVRAEFQRVRQGAHTTYLRMDLDYVSFPLLVRVGLPAGYGVVRPYGLAGVAPFHETGCAGVAAQPQPYTLVLGWPWPTQWPMEPLDCLDYRTDGIDLATVLGLGAYLGDGPLRVSVEVRSSRGRRNIASEYPFASAHNRGTTVLMGMSWRPAWRRPGQ